MIMMNTFQKNVSPKEYPMPCAEICEEARWLIDQMIPERVFMIDFACQGIIDMLEGRTDSPYLNKRLTELYGKVIEIAPICESLEIFSVSCEDFRRSPNRDYYAYRYWPMWDDQLKLEITEHDSRYNRHHYKLCLERKSSCESWAENWIQFMSGAVTAYRNLNEGKASFTTSPFQNAATLKYLCKIRNDYGFIEGTLEGPFRNLNALAELDFHYSCDYKNITELLSPMLEYADTDEKCLELFRKFDEFILNDRPKTILGTPMSVETWWTNPVGWLWWRRKMNTGLKGSIDRFLTKEYRDNEDKENRIHWFDVQNRLAKPKTPWLRGLRRECRSGNEQAPVSSQPVAGQDRTVDRDRQQGQRADVLGKKTRKRRSRRVLRKDEEDGTII